MLPVQVIDQNGRDVTAETIGAVSKIIGGAGVGLGGSIEDLRKATGTITVAQNLVAYDLEAPAKNLYPVLTPIRNSIPRQTRGSGAGTAANWVQVDAIAGNSVAGILPWVPEGQRAGRMQITTSQKSASYKTIGLETDVTFEAQSAGMGFEDVMSTAGTRLLQQTMIQEEHAILGGNLSVALGTPATPTSSASGAAATLPALTYSVYVFALTYEGYQMATIAGGIKRLLTVTGMDGLTYTLNGGSSITSANKTQAVTLGQTLFLNTTTIKGAVAYAWYVGAAGAERLEAITTINSLAISAPLLGTGQLYSAVTVPGTDYSLNTTGFDGLLYTAWNSSLAYYKALAPGTAGTGTALTASGRGTISEIDTALKAFWDSYRVSPEVIYVNSQELTNIYNKVFVSGANPMVRFNIDAGSNNVSFTAGAVVGFYMNPYSLDGGNVIPIKLHPTLPAGIILFWCNNLPAFYQSANVPQVAQVQCRRDYYQIPWPIVTRANATGVYSEEVLKVYAPFALGTITNIANG
jgi:hypothetical protein